MKLTSPAAWSKDSAAFKSVVDLDAEFMNYPWNEAEWELLDSSKKLFLWEDEAVFGFALYQLSPLEELAHLLKIVVHPSIRGSIESSEFWQAQVSALKSLGLKTIYLEVAVENERAQRFYRKMGAQLLRRVKGFYRDGSDALTMSVAI
ncbi:MAG: GNAT family N-acetyltransferase [Bacteriovoracia bacterium]